VWQDVSGSNRCWSPACSAGLHGKTLLAVVLSSQFRIVPFRGLASACLHQKISETPLASFPLTRSTKNLFCVAPLPQLLLLHRLAPCSTYLGTVGIWSASACDHGGYVVCAERDSPRRSTPDAKRLTAALLGVVADELITCCACVHVCARTHGVGRTVAVACALVGGYVMVSCAAHNACGRLLVLSNKEILNTLPPYPSAWGLWGESTTGGREDLVRGGDGKLGENAPHGTEAERRLGDSDPSAPPPPLEKIAPSWLHTQYQQQPPGLPYFRPPLLVRLSHERPDAQARDHPHTHMPTSFL
jgi:hypothetical protein